MKELSDLNGVGPAIAERLRDSGFTTLESVATATPPELSSAAEIGEGKAAKMIRQAQEGVDGMGYELGTDVLQRRKEVDRIPTGSESLDEMLGGGIETQGMTEFYGEFRTGKTQLSHQLSVNAQLLNGKNGESSHVVYIDTEHTFRPERIEKMAEAMEIEAQEALERIHVARASTTDHQMLLVEKVTEIAEGNEVKLLIVDGLMSNFRTEYVGRGALAERQQKLGKHLSDLHDLAEKHNLAVFVTNHVQSDPNSFFGDPTKPIGGHVLGHAATVRVYLKKGKKNKRKARLIDHPERPPENVQFQITEQGVRD
ncbi:DNA repair and recombination protein RadA [candidate division MSBL1 archaeon SCGC-AAA382A13]|uniref:DNA repair and recombination protein RadA n=1 Tax=candidate division MSBL1 archaeon SCGC-AAA382A13 TaxID=1698279 RepID=A0A133VFR7_9EURY|nr:DNA repair and recombination protein RadA [candidate division MSBL1 archaeon SCGC-AAA382A13]